MHVARGKDVNPVRNTDQMFTGEVHSHLLASEDHGKQMRINFVRFSPGGRTRWHRHPFEQALIVVEGRGIVATEETENVVEPGDVVLVALNEKHWHGGTQETGMAHIAVNGVGENVLLEPVEKIRGAHA